MPMNHEVNTVLQSQSTIRLSGQDSFSEQEMVEYVLALCAILKEHSDNNARPTFSCAAQKIWYDIIISCIIKK